MNGMKSGRMQRYLTSIVESSDDAMFGKDLSGTILTWNPGAEKLYGYAAEEMIGRSVLTLCRPERRDEVAEFLERVRRGECVHHYETERIRKDGQSIEVLLTISPVRDARGRAQGASAIARDITGQKRAEEQIRELNAALERRVAERTAELQAVNKELETFSYSVSHDLRTPLRAIDGFCQVLIEDYAGKLDFEGRDLLLRMRAASQRTDAMILGILELSRTTRSELHRRTVDMSVMARAVALELRKADPGRQVEFEIAADLVVAADPDLLRVVLENLLGNAWKFTSKHSSARIEVGSLQKEGQTVLFVRDDGVGFDMAHAGKLFGAFQRLHTPSEFEGAGVGLSNVQRIIHRHGGRIWAEAELEKGATFFFTMSGGLSQE